jgi:hypothetical protein
MVEPSDILAVADEPLRRPTSRFGAAWLLLDVSDCSVEEKEENG